RTGDQHSARPPLAARSALLAGVDALVGLDAHLVRSDSQLLAAVEDTRLVQPHLVHERAVARSEIAQHSRASVLAGDLGVVPRNLLVGDLEVVVVVTPDRQATVVQRDRL